jgi:hypothetical protein
MTRREIITKAINEQISWVATADIIGITDSRCNRAQLDVGGDGSAGRKPLRKRIATQTIREWCRLKHEVYPDFSIRHFYERLTEQHAEQHTISVSYTHARLVLQEAGIVEKEPGRGPLPAPARAPCDGGNAGPSGRPHP